MSTYSGVPGSRVEPIGRVWAAFSPVSGETLLLNDTSAAILEILEQGPADTATVAAAFAADQGLSPAQIEPLLDASWQDLIAAGLVRRVAPLHSPPR